MWLCFCLQSLPSGEMPYRGVLDCGVKIFKQEGTERACFCCTLYLFTSYIDNLTVRHYFTWAGIFAFWRGFGAYYGRCAPHSMIILITNEELNKLYQQYVL